MGPLMHLPCLWERAARQRAARRRAARAASGFGLARARALL